MNTTEVQGRLLTAARALDGLAHACCALTNHKTLGALIATAELVAKELSEIANQLDIDEIAARRAAAGR